VAKIVQTIFIPYMGSGMRSVVLYIIWCSLFEMFYIAVLFAILLRDKLFINCMETMTTIDVNNNTLI